MSSCSVVEWLEFKARLNSYEYCNSEQSSQAQFLFRWNKNNNTTCLIVFLWELNEVMHKSPWKQSCNLSEFDFLNLQRRYTSSRCRDKTCEMPKQCLVLSNCPTATAKSLQSCPSLCDPINGSPPGSPDPGILQARTLEWVAISFSSAWNWKVKSESEVAQSCPTLSDPMDCSLLGSSAHGIFQARVLEWGAIAFSELPH